MTPAFEAGLRAALAGEIPVPEVSREEVSRLCAEQDARNRVVEIARRWKHIRRDRTVPSGTYADACAELADAVDALEALSASQSAPVSGPTTEPSTPATRSHSPRGDANRETPTPTDNRTYDGGNDD